MLFPWFTKKSALSVGAYGEKLAQEEYKKRGFSIIATNEFNRNGKQLGEIDFIAKKGSVVVFVEVKTRTHGAATFGTGLEAVHVGKQQKLVRAVHSFMTRNPRYQSFQPRIDVCSIVVESVDKSPKSVTILENVVEDWN